MPDYLTVSAVNKRDTVVAVLVADKYLLTLMIGVKVSDVHSVAVHLLCGPEEFSVIVDSAGAHADLLLAVVVEVCNHYVMVSAAVSRIGLVKSCVEYPLLHQLLVLYINS